MTPRGSETSFGPTGAGVPHAAGECGSGGRGGVAALDPAVPASPTTWVGGRLAATFGGVSGGLGAFGTLHNVCHYTCQLVVTGLALAGITLTGLPLAFLEDPRLIVLFGGMGTVSLGASMALHVRTKGRRFAAPGPRRLFDRRMVVLLAFLLLSGWSVTQGAAQMFRGSGAPESAVRTSKNGSVEIELRLLDRADASSRDGLGVRAGDELHGHVRAVVRDPRFEGGDQRARRRRPSAWHPADPPAPGHRGDRVAPGLAWHGCVRSTCSRTFLLLVAGGAATACLAPAHPPPVQPEPRVPVSVVTHAWHTGIAFRLADAPGQVERLRAEFAGAESIEVGTGNREYWMAPEPTIGQGLWAGLLPSESAVRVMAFRGAIGAFFVESDILEVELTRAGLARLAGFVDRSLALDGHAALIPLGPGRAATTSRAGATTRSIIRTRGRQRPCAKAVCRSVPRSRSRPRTSSVR